MLKQVLKIFLLFVIVLAVVIVWVIHSSFAAERILTFALNKSLRDAKVEKLVIGHQKFIFPGEIVFSDVDVQMNLKKEALSVQFKNLRCEGLDQLFKPSTDLKLYGKGIAFKGYQADIPSADATATISLHSWRLKEWSGDVSVPDMEVHKYRLYNFTSKIQGRPKSLTLSDIDADFYKGKIVGRINVDWANGMRFKTDVQFKGVDIRAMRYVDASIYGQIEGVIRGSFSLEGTPQNFSTLGLKIAITKDGRLNASLLKFVLPYIPRTQESVQLQDLMKQGQKVPIEVAYVDLESIDDHNLSGKLKLGVRQLNLDLNLQHDISYDGNLFSLIEWYRQLST